MLVDSGIGLPEWSPLVVRGKEDQEERKDYLMKIIENAKEMHTTRHILEHSRRESLNSISGPVIGRV
jgi:hypothetical protein